MASPIAYFLVLSAIIVVLFSSTQAEVQGSFDDNFSKSCPETHFKTSEDGQIWYLSLDNKAGKYVTYSQISL